MIAESFEVGGEWSNLHLSPVRAENGDYFLVYTSPPGTGTPTEAEVGAMAACSELVITDPLSLQELVDRVKHALNENTWSTPILIRQADCLFTLPKVPNDPFEAGRHAFRLGLHQNGNYYGENDPRNDHWLSGWLEEEHMNTGKSDYALDAFARER